MNLRVSSDKITNSISQADRFRDEKRWPEAAAAYRSILQEQPEMAGIWVQLGHCLKEASDFPGGERADFEALALIPSASDLHLQLGHLEKVRGQLEQAAYYYSQCLRLDS